jgi:hypothetical protein
LKEIDGLRYDFQKRRAILNRKAHSKQDLK